jgi:hypothetical protein
VKIWDFIRGALPEIQGLPREVQSDVAAAALKRLRERSFFLRYFAECCAVVGVLLGYVVAYLFAPRGVIGSHGHFNPELFGRLMMWNILAPPFSAILSGWLGFVIRNRLLRKEVPHVIEDCLHKVQSTSS